LALKDDQMMNDVNYTGLWKPLKDMYDVSVPAIAKVTQERKRQNDALIKRYLIKTTRGVPGVEAALGRLLRAGIHDAVAVAAARPEGKSALLNLPYWIRTVLPVCDMPQTRRTNWIRKLACSDFIFDLWIPHVARR